MQSDNIQVAFAKDDVGALALFGKIQTVQNPTLAVNRSLRRVHVLWFRLVQHTAAKGHHVTPCVNDGKHQSIAEFVVQTAIAVLDDQTGIQKFLLGITLAGHCIEQGIPGIQRGTEAEFHSGGFADLTAIQVVLNGPAFRLLQQLIIKAGSIPVEIQKALSAAAGLAVAVFFRNFQSGPFGKKTYGVRIVEVFHFHDEVDDTAALFAAKAMINLLVLQHMEGRGLFVVERAAAPITAAFADQRNIAAYNIHDIVPSQQLVHEVSRECHRGVPPFAQFCQKECLSYRFTVIYTLGYKGDNKYIRRGF